VFAHALHARDLGGAGCDPEGLDAGEAAASLPVLHYKLDEPAARGPAGCAKAVGDGEFAVYSSLQGSSGTGDKLEENVHHPDFYPQNQTFSFGEEGEALQASLPFVWEGNPEHVSYVEDTVDAVAALGPSEGGRAFESGLGGWSEPA